jgi:hypothetical protein
MNIRVDRKWFTTRSSVGVLTIDGDPFTCFTIEDVARAPGVKIDKETAIPADTFLVVMDWSPRHSSIQPHIMNVPLFVGIRFDVANWAEQLEGCIAVGNGRGDNAVLDSKAAHKVLCEKIQAAINKGELVWVTISNRQERKP